MKNHKNKLFIAVLITLFSLKNNAIAKNKEKQDNNTPKEKSYEIKFYSGGGFGVGAGVVQEFYNDPAQDQQIFGKISFGGHGRIGIDINFKNNAYIATEMIFESMWTTEKDNINKIEKALPNFATGINFKFGYAFNSGKTKLYSIFGMDFHMLNLSKITKKNQIKMAGDFTIRAKAGIGLRQQITKKMHLFSEFTFVSDMYTRRTLYGTYLDPNNLDAQYSVLSFRRGQDVSQNYDENGAALNDIAIEFSTHARFMFGMDIVF